MTGCSLSCAVAQTPACFQCRELMQLLQKLVQAKGTARCLEGLLLPGPGSTVKGVTALVELEVDQWI